MLSTLLGVFSAGLKVASVVASPIVKTAGLATKLTTPIIAPVAEGALKVGVAVASPIVVSKFAKGK